MHQGKCLKLFVLFLFLSTKCAVHNFKDTPHREQMCDLSSSALSLNTKYGNLHTHSYFVNVGKTQLIVHQYTCMRVCWKLMDLVLCSLGGLDGLAIQKSRDNLGLGSWHTYRKINPQSWLSSFCASSEVQKRIYFFELQVLTLYTQSVLIQCCLQYTPAHIVTSVENYGQCMRWCLKALYAAITWTLCTAHMWFCACP